MMKCSLLAAFFSAKNVWCPFYYAQKYVILIAKNVEGGDMMLKIIYGADRLRNSEEIISRICANAKNGIGGQILIVPEQFSHETERALCAAGGDSICRFAEVLSFSRLAERVACIYGGSAEQYLDHGGRFLTLCRAVDQVRHRLKFFASASMKAEFLQSLGAVMEEFLAGGVSSEDLTAAAKKTEGRFAQKLTELSILYESYLSVCKTGRNDPVTRLQRLQRQLEEEEYASGRIIYVDGFTDFTAIERNILTALMKQANELTLSLATDGSMRSAYAASTRTKKEVIRAANRWYIPVEQQLMSNFTHRSNEICTVLDHLFTANKTEFTEQTEKICLHQAQSVEHECAYAAGRVRQLLRAGYRRRDICIAVTDRARYYPDLRAIFARAHIPAYFAGSNAVLQMPLFASILAVLQAADRFDYDSVMQYLKSPLCTLDADACDRLERYAYLWNIRGSVWQSEWMMHPHGLGEEWKDEAKAELEQINVWRQQATDPLAKLHKNMRAAQNVGQMTQALADFFEQVSLKDTLRAQTQKLAHDGNMQKAQELQQAYENLLSALESLYEVLGDAVLDTETFAQIFRMMLGEYHVSTIPASIDDVQVGTLEDFRHKKAPCLIVLGAEDGLLPSFGSDTSILTDDERKKLLSMELPIAPAQAERLDRAMGNIRLAFSLATDRLELCCSAEQPSFIFTRMQSIFPNVTLTTDADRPFAADELQAAAIVCREHSAVCPQELSAIRDDLKLRTEYTFTPMSEQTVQELYGNRITLSASRIDKFASCKFAYFMQYGLKAEPWKQARFDAPIFGTFVHWVLEQTVHEIRTTCGFAALTDELLAEMIKKYISAYTQRYMPDLSDRGARFAYLYERNFDEVLSVAEDVVRELRASKFIPVDEELAFSFKEGGLNPVEIAGKNASCQIIGYVDRVDLFERDGKYYCRIVDYKTGHKDFDYAEILCGQGLQMLIYLFTLEKFGAERYGKPLIPAGVMYVPARTDMQPLKPGCDIVDLQTARMKTRRRKGLVLHEEGILKAMEDTDAPQYLPCRKKKDGYTGNLADAAQMQMLGKFVTQSVADMADEIVSGNVTPDPIIRGPMHSACQYCDYASVCHMDLCKHEMRSIKSVKPEQFWSEVERRLEHE